MPTTGNMTSLILTEYSEMVETITEVRESSFFSSGYKQLWPVTVVKVFVVRTLGIKFDEPSMAKNNPLVGLGENNVMVRLSDIILAVSGMAAGTFSNAKTRHSRVAKAIGLVDDNDGVVLTAPQRSDLLMLRALLGERQLNQDSALLNAAERRAASVTQAYLLTVLIKFEGEVKALL